MLSRSYLSKQIVRYWSWVVVRRRERKGGERKKEAYSLNAEQGKVEVSFWFGVWA